MSTMTFATVAAYKAAKASGGDIYNALMNTTDLTKSITSYITDIGQTAVDTMNPIVEAPYGSIGDTLMYCTTDSKYYWLKTRAGINAGTIGCSFARTALLTNYTIIGVLVYKNGDDGLIMSDSLDSMPWCLCEDGSTYAITFDNMSTLTSVKTKRAINRSAWCTSLGLELRERLSAAYNQYSNPFPRSAWDAMMLALNSNSAVSANQTNTTPTSGSGNYSATPSQWSWKVEITNKVPVATFSFVMEGGTNAGFNPSEWNFSFDKFYKDCIQCQNPAPNGTVIGELSGRENTERMVAFIAAYNADSSHASNKIKYTSSTNAACACVSRNVTTADGQFATGRWWLPNISELTLATKIDKILYKKGINLADAYIWSSTQSSQNDAWYVNTDSSNCRTGSHYKNNLLTVRAFSAYHFPKS